MDLIFGIWVHNANARAVVNVEICGDRERVNFIDARCGPAFGRDLLDYLQTRVLRDWKTVLRSSSVVYISY